MKKRLSGILILFAFPLFITLQAQEYGMAGSYSDDFDGGMTAYGEAYDKDKLTCAHKKHGMGTMLRITRLDNKKTVVVRVNDKGPYIKGRVVDVSKAAAQKLGLIKDGVAEVKVEILSKSNEAPITKQETPRVPEERPQAAEDTSPRITFDDPTPPKNNSESATSTTETSKPKTTEREKSPTTSNSGSSSSGTIKSRLVTKDYTPYGLYKIRLERPVQVGFGVQIVSLTNYENVLRQVADLQAQGFSDVLVSVEPDFDQTSVYKIILGSFQTSAQAKSYQASLKKKHKLNGFVVDLNEPKY